MRYREITNLPSTPDEARNSILDLLAVYRSKDKPSIQMEEILTLLHNQGFDADRRWVMDTLKNREGVIRITPAEVILQTDAVDDSAISTSELEKSQDKVNKMAAKAAKKGIQ